MFLFIVKISLSQSDFCFQKEIDFAHHLTHSKEYKNAIFVLKNLKCDRRNNDSLFFLIGFNYYQINQLDSAKLYFDKVRDGDTSLYIYSRFLVNYILTKTLKFRESANLLSTLEHNKINKIENFKELQIAGNKLLMKDFGGFNQLYSTLKNNNFEYHNELYNLNWEAEKYLKFKQKSMLKAGLLSAIVPGLGKWYAGSKGEFLGALLPILLLGGVAAESYVVSGLQSPHFILYSSLFTVFYVGNIWGSVLSVKVKQKKANEAFENAVLVNLQIPLDRIFK